jgi:hypothetical protein
VPAVGAASIEAPNASGAEIALAMSTSNSVGLDGSTTRILTDCPLATAAGT